MITPTDLSQTSKSPQPSKEGDHMRGIVVGTPISLLLWYSLYRAWIELFATG